MVPHPAREWRIGEGFLEEMRSTLSIRRQVDVNQKREGKSSQREQNEKRHRVGWIVTK